ncbi:MAG TPA: hypothetical protein DCQ31_13190 [Bacteroidales bacterium]|nr:hypothetical protein [Bacteroidales bacterium]
MNDNSRFLIIRFEGTEELALACQLALDVQTQVENADVEFLTAPNQLEFVKQQTGLEYVHSFVNNRVTGKEMKYLHFDYVIDLEDTLSSNQLTNRIGRYTFTAPNFKFKKLIKSLLGIGTVPKLSLVERFYTSVKHFDVVPKNLNQH